MADIGYRGYRRGMILDDPVRRCAYCADYKGLVECESCWKTYCVFCDGIDVNVCPDCEDVRLED